MDSKYNEKVGKELQNICKRYSYEKNDEINRRKIGCEIKDFLEKEKIDFEVINTYTSPEKVHLGLIDIEIDGENYSISTFNL